MQSPRYINIALCVCICVAGLVQAAPCEESTPAPATTLAERAEVVFGPLKTYDLFVTGVDFDRLMRSELGPSVVLARREAKPYEVRYVYRTSDQSEGVPFMIASVGVFAGQKVANSVLMSELSRISAPMPSSLGIGDRAFVSERRAILLVNNVYVSLYSPTDKLPDGLVSAVVRELENGGNYATKGEIVTLPAIASVGLSASARLGTSARGKIVMVDAEPSELLFGKGDDDSEITVSQGLEPEVTYHSPSVAKEAGAKRYTLCAATAGNVIATKQFTVQVD